MKGLIVSLVLLLAVVLLVVGWLIALPNVGKLILAAVLVLAVIVGILVELPELRRYFRIRAM